MIGYGGGQEFAMDKIGEVSGCSFGHRGGHVGVVVWQKVYCHLWFQSYQQV